MKSGRAYLRGFGLFMLVGGLAFLVDTTITLALAAFIHYLLANAVGFAIAFLVNFLLGHRIAFDQPFALASLRRALPGVLAISLSGLALSSGFMLLFHGTMALPLLPSKVATAGLVMMWNFGLRYSTVYRESTRNG